MTRRKKPRTPPQAAAGSRTEATHQRKSNSITLARRSTALTIAGSDPSGGAGLQADLKAFQHIGVYGMSVVTLVTVQNTVGVDRIEVMPVDLVVEQLDGVLSDIPPLAIKTGALGSPAILRAVAERLATYQGDLVVDPVLISKHGHRLAEDAMIEAYRTKLLPLATIVTPNRYEAEAIVGRKLTNLDACCQAACEMQELGADYVLIKAGMIDGLREHVYADADQVLTIGVGDLPGNHGHGAGCCLSALIAARMTLSSPEHPHSQRMRQAVDFALKAVHASISLAPPLGKGCLPIEHRALHLGRD